MMNFRELIMVEEMALIIIAGRFLATKWLCHLSSSFIYVNLPLLGIILNAMYPFANVFHQLCMDVNARFIKVFSLFQCGARCIPMGSNLVATINIHSTSALAAIAPARLFSCLTVQLRFGAILLARDGCLPVSRPALCQYDLLICICSTHMYGCFPLTTNLKGPLNRVV
jgi:hypothetical protein